MYDSSAVWTFTNTLDGTTITANNGSSGLWIETVTGFDSPNVRQNVQELPEFDGAVASDFYLGARPVTFSGKIVGSTASARNTIASNLQRATRGLRNDVTIATTASGQPAMNGNARLDNLRITGGFVKDFILSMIMPDPRMYSPTLHTSFATGTTPSVTVSNAGNYWSPPILKATGPASNFNFANTTTGATALTTDGAGAITMTAGQTLQIDIGTRTVSGTFTVPGGGSPYRILRHSFTTSFWELQPGSNTVVLAATGTTSATRLDVSWYDAWV